MSWNIFLRNKGSIPRVQSNTRLTNSLLSDMLRIKSYIDKYFFFRHNEIVLGTNKESD